MDYELIFRITFIINYIIFAGVRIYYRSQNLGRKSEKELNQWTKSIIVLMFAILGYFLAISLWILVPQIIFVFQIDIPPLLRWLGVIIALLATVLLWWIHHTLGQQYSARLEIQEEHQLIKVGPYHRVRHPMYTTFNLFSLSVSIISANLLIIFFAVFIAIPFYWISKTEEEMLIEQFKDDYLQYMKITGRFIPRFAQAEEK
ncbi:MAG: isoprenylcysteine carboxylmethyltransferase family protein [Candidatus Hodarchaeales archaeon]